ncbi:MAG: alpha/beta fold hydrolase [Anaerolineales bacterium]|nr:alpha/beta fold hydrolase [Anaerolineales bacterium]
MESDRYGSVRTFRALWMALGLLLACGLLAACGGTAEVEHTMAPTAPSAPTQTATPTPTPLPTATPSPTPTPSPTATPTPVPTPTPTPHPFAAHTIEGLRARDYPGGAIEILEEQAVTEDYTRYLIAYPSDDLRITGILQIPHGEGPFPVIILNHGYIPPEQYVSGSDTWRPADYLARRRYLTLSPDFRGWAGSDEGDTFFRAGLVVDALNLISSLPSLPQADVERIGMWGHSMGGGVTSKAIVVDPRIKAAVLYGPVSAHEADVVAKWGGEMLDNVGTPDARQELFAQVVQDPEFLELASPIYYFSAVTAPVEIHQGAADTTTPPEWAEAIRAALEAEGKDVAYYSYPGQGHAFQGQSWTLFLERITAFYDRVLKGE